jgi:DNA modification methylase
LAYHESSTDQPNQPAVLLTVLLSEFCETLGVEWQLPRDLATAARKAIASCGCDPSGTPSERRSLLLGLVNNKFGFKEPLFQTLLNRAAEQGVVLNYHEKIALRSAIDFGDQSYVHHWITRSGFVPDLLHIDSLSADNDTLRLFAQQLVNPTITRSDARACHPEERRQEILRSLFAGFVFRSFPIERMHAHFNPESSNDYLADFYDHLLRHDPSILHRECSLVFLVVEASTTSDGSQLREDIYEFIEQTYRRLSNHCYLAILIKPLPEGTESGQWRLFSDVVLYAEKFQQTRLQTGYFQPQKIADATLEHIPRLSRTVARFELANEGFFFRDAFILPHGDQVGCSDYDMLLTFEKNQRDERPIACPACRSFNVRGNSYPVLGVKSWECQNILCPERSAFDRGNRYSLAALIKQRAIASEVDQITAESLRRWKLDLVPGASEEEVVEMLIRHFTLHGDKVVFVNSGQHGRGRFGRRIKYESLRSATELRYDAFQNSPLFARFLAPKKADHDWEYLTSPESVVGVYRGDAFDVLSSIESASIDGAVTSPPYYNARSYSVWPNIYCYLHDMYNIAREVYRTLRSGGYFVFNIFDYFDNENTIVLSTMGKKRMILGAYIINIFRRIGFELQGNTIWYKGEIEGKRNFNQGNRSPYYQLPLNCWEHVFAFRKPGERERKVFPPVLSARPVLKMVRGRNTLGHSAPFPPEIPELLIGQLNNGERVLDPFAGSMTTARAARRFGLGSISIDLHLEYCLLGLELLKKEEADSTLFRSVA